MNDIPFDGPDLQDSHSRRADLSPCRFDRIDLTQARIVAHMPGVQFYSCDMAGATFDDINLSDARFDDVNLSGARIGNATLQGACISDANLRDVTIDNADLGGMTINGILVTDLLAAHADRRDGT